jgi:hypothetical protein
LQRALEIPLPALAAPGHSRAGAVYDSSPDLVAELIPVAACRRRWVAGTTDAKLSGKVV